ncbi:uncharacterized protein SOCE836_057710 [Sorangium cellulosum]|uniref:Uncharacterized protein n=1 Tax=Sorangium cellulosum TaxID=56 RepID=A0A4P2QTI6_SORCE|nr:uncharacterized protein SOCE836_057710 [Sorangium cellulosum]
MPARLACSSTCRRRKPVHVASERTDSLAPRGCTTSPACRGHDPPRHPGQAAAAVDGRWGRHERWPGLNHAPDGAHGIYSGDACSGAIIAGGPAVVNPCEGGIPSAFGKGGDGLADGAADGEAGEPVPAPDLGHDGQGGG